MANREKISQLIAFVSAFSLFDAEDGVGFENANLGMDAQLILLKVSRIYDSKTKHACSIIFTSLLNLFTHLDAPLFILNLSFLKGSWLGTQKFIERDIAIYEQLHGGLKLTLVFPN